jgi:putative membrane protein
MKRIFGLVVTLVAGGAQTAEAAVEPCTWWPGMMSGWGWSSMVFGPLLMVLVLAVVIAAAVLLVRWVSGPWRPAGPLHYPLPGRSALDILKERFARGEIDKHEFEERRRVLGE